MIFSSSYINSCGGSFVPLPSTRITKNKVFCAGRKQKRKRLALMRTCSRMVYRALDASYALHASNELLSVVEWCEAPCLICGTTIRCDGVFATFSIVFFAVISCAGRFDHGIIIIQPRVKFDGACWILDYFIIYITIQSRGNRKLPAARILHPMVKIE